MQKNYFLLCFFLGLSTFSLAQTWENVSSLPATAALRHHPINFSIDGMGYIVTGAKPLAGVLNDFYRYDPEADTWTTLPSFPGGSRGFGYGVNTATKGYIGFGLFENESTFEIVEYNDLWEYDPATETWTELATCPCAARYHPAMVLVNDKIYVGLGANQFGDLKDWWEYDIATDTWTEKTDFPSTQRHHPYYFGIGDYVYVGFGHHTSSIYNDFYRYDPATDTWTALNDFPDQGRVAGTQFSYDGKGYILSGQGETHNNLPTGEFWEYDPDTDSWEALTPHPGGGRWAPGNFVIGDKVFFNCGQSNTGERKDVMVYDFSSSAEIDENATTSHLLFPNPTNGQLTLQAATGTFNQLVIFNAAGQEVHKQTLSTSTIDLSKLEAGVYIVQLHSTEKTVTEKLIIQ